MISQILLFVALIFMANVALFAPNIQSLKEAQAVNTDTNKLNNNQLLLSSIAKDTYFKKWDRRIDIRPPAAFKRNGSVYSAYSADTDRAELEGIFFAADSANIPRYLPDKYHGLATGAENFRYCPYAIGDAPANLSTHQLGYIYRSPPPTFSPPGSMPDNFYDDIVLFVVVMNNDIATCNDALKPENKRDPKKVLFFTVGDARSVLRSRQVETAGFNSSTCPAGQDMVWVPEHQSENDENTTIPARFQCRRNVLGIAAIDENRNNSNCTGPRAILPVGRDDNGFSCAPLAVQNIQMVAQTQDNTVGPTVGDSATVTLYDPVDYFKPIGPVSAPDKIPVAVIPNIANDPNAGRYEVLPGLDGFDCPALYNEVYPEPAFPGPRSKFVAVLPNGQLQCIKSWSMLLPPRNICPDGKRILWLPRYGQDDYLIGPINTLRGMRFMCEGYAANDPTYGSFSISQVCRDDIAGPVSFVYSPQTNKVACYLTPTRTIPPDTLVTYPTAPNPCNNNGVADLAAGDIVDCSTDFKSIFDNVVRSSTGYQDNWALNINSSNNFYGVNPGTVKFVIVGEAVGMNANSANMVPDETTTGSTCVLPPKTPGGASPGTGIINASGVCVDNTNVNNANPIPGD